MWIVGWHNKTFQDIKIELNREIESSKKSKTKLELVIKTLGIKNKSSEERVTILVKVLLW